MKERGIIVKISQKICSTFVIIFAIITLCLVILHFLHFPNDNLDIIMIFVGLTTFSGGLSQINRTQQMDSEGNSNGNKINKKGVASILWNILAIL